MNDETPLLRSIDWKSVLPVLQIFRAFRVAIHPSKMALAMVAIILVMIGGRLLDAIYWNDRPVPNEISMVYEDALASGGRVDFDSFRANERKRYEEMRESLKLELLGDIRKHSSDQAIDPVDVDSGMMVASILRQRNEAISRINEAAKPTTQPNSFTLSPEDRDVQIRQTYRIASEQVALATLSRFKGPFATFVDYELLQVEEIAMGVIRFDWLPGEDREPGRSGVFMGLYRFVIVGPSWALSHYFFSFLLISAWALLVWSIFGGAIARIAAVHIAKDSTISIRQALRFSFAKLFSFLSAPLLPLALVAACALVFALAGWISEIRAVGSVWTIVLGIAFVVVLGIAAFMACALFGTIAGFGLMYPTIAIEGSDSFDAISRSFSYVFARPWKMSLYSIVGLIHGAVTYLFLRFMLCLTLGVTHFFLTAWTHDRGADGSTSIANVFVGPPSFHQLTVSPDRAMLTNAEAIASYGVHFWLYLFVALLGAYLLSVYVSTNTIIYFLLRQDVDATELDDVYLEPMEDDFDYTSEVTESGPPDKHDSPASTAPPADTKTSDAPPDVPDPAKPSNDPSGPPPAAS